MGVFVELWPSALELRYCLEVIRPIIERVPHRYHACFRPLDCDAFRS